MCLWYLTRYKIEPKTKKTKYISNTKPKYKTKYNQKIHRIKI